jgi:MFS family permease
VDDHEDEDAAGAEEKGEAFGGLPRGPGAVLPGAPARRPPAVPLGAHAFASLRHRNFRIFWWGQVVSLTGTWMQATALGWLVLTTTDSEFLLGLTTATQSLPVLLFTLYAGVIADRFDKRRILVVALAFSMLQALLLAVLVDTGQITFALILALVVALGTANAFEIPTRQAFFVDMVGKEDLTNAIALNSAAFNASRIVGPAIAGALIASVGMASVFYINALSYTAVIGGLLLLRLPRHTTAPATASARVHLAEGFAFIRGAPVARALVGLIAALSILGFPYVMLLPVFARDILLVGAPGLGWMLSASGAGALAGGIALAAFGHRTSRGRLLIVSSSLFSLLLIGFAFSRSFTLSLLLLAAMGFTMILNNATTNALLQAIVPDHLRGRVMAVYVFMFLGMAPLGSLQAGAIARWLGAPVALSLGAVALLLVVFTVWRLTPSLRAIS